MQTNNKDITILDIDDGITAWSFPIKSIVNDFNFLLERNEILWVCSSKQSITLKINFIPHPIQLQESESILLAYQKESWHVDIQDLNMGLICVVITLKALHALIAANFNEDNMDESSVDYSQMSKVVSLSPKILSELSSLFTNKDSGIFKGLQRKGKFLTAFSAMMEKVFGKVTDQCPFQMDRVTEQKIRDVRSLIIQDLSLLPDTQQLSFSVDIPKTILKQGFKFIYGKSRKLT